MERACIVSMNNALKAADYEEKHNPRWENVQLRTESGMRRTHEGDIPQATCWVSPHRLVAWGSPQQCKTQAGENLSESGEKLSISRMCFAGLRDAAEKFSKDA